MATARTIIELALEAMNKLSPGETLDADVGAVCLRRLNVIADDWSAGRDMMAQDRISTDTVTGTSIALGAGAFATVGIGADVITLQSDGLPMTRITMGQYTDIPVKTQTGRPEVWAHDGLATLYLYPAAVASVVSLLARVPFANFDDLDTDYAMPPGYRGAFAASLAVALAPSLLGGVTPGLVAAKREAMFNVAGGTVRPAIISASPLAPRCAGNILNGWN